MKMKSNSDAGRLFIIHHQMADFQPFVAIIWMTFALEKHPRAAKRWWSIPMILCRISSMIFNLDSHSQISKSSDEIWFQIIFDQLFVKISSVTVIYQCIHVILLKVSLTYYLNNIFDIYSINHAIYLTSPARKFVCIHKASSQFMDQLLWAFVR
jgi:hypothetical protein